MSLFKLIEITKTSEKESQSIYDKDSLNEAVNAMHNDFGVAVKQDATIGAYCVVIDNTTGAQTKVLQWGVGVKDRVYTHNDYADDNISAYDSEKLAIGNFHTKVASQRNHEGCKHAITVRLGSMGNFADYDVYDDPTQSELAE